jgi:alpha-1,3-rhamnosyltransferase
LLQQPLVSIIVATYNSGKFVIETLESAKAQTYLNLALIISDDCSADNTVAICQDWVTANGHRFVSTRLITVPQNTGVSANCNRCIHAAQTTWIKFIAGDDILLPNCITDNMEFVAANPSAKAVFSEVLLYQGDFKKENFLNNVPQGYPMNIMNPKFSVEDQYKILLISDRITYTPSVFLNRETLLLVGGYDETNRLIEDYPMWLKLTRAGNKLYFFNTATVGYRMHKDAANNMANYGLFKPLFLTAALIRKKEAYPYLPWDIVGREKHIVFISRGFQKSGLNKKTRFCHILYKTLTVYFNPFIYIIYFKKKVLKIGATNSFYAD